MLKQEEQSIEVKPKRFGCFFVVKRGRIYGKIMRKGRGSWRGDRSTLKDSNDYGLLNHNDSGSLNVRVNDSDTEATYVAKEQLNSINYNLWGDNQDYMTA